MLKVGDTFTLHGKKYRVDKILKEEGSEELTYYSEPRPGLNGLLITESELQMAVK